jgi:endonuclease/exonuclease/phosphatase family metal-dependent hydrolase
VTVRNRLANSWVAVRCVALLVALSACASPVERADPQTLTVLSYNIKRGLGNDGVTDIARAAEVIRRLDPDFVALQEIDHGVERSGRIEQMRVLGELTGMHPSFASFMPYQGGEYGIGVLSRYPIIESRRHELPPGTEPRVALDVRVSLPDDTELIFCSVHFYNTAAQRLAQAKAVIDVYRDEKLPVILAGDFNSTPGDPVMLFVERSFRNTDKVADRFTFSATDPDREIDYVLFKPADAFAATRVDVLDEPVVSDHRPVIVELQR